MNLESSSTARVVRQCDDLTLTKPSDGYRWACAALSVVSNKAQRWLSLGL